MPVLAVSTVSAAPGQPPVVQTPAARVVGLPFAARLAGILDAAPASAAGVAAASSQPVTGDERAGVQDDPIPSTRTEEAQGPHPQQRAGTAPNAGDKPAKTDSASRIIRLAGAKPGGPEAPQSTAATTPSVAVKPSSAGMARSASAPDSNQVLSGAADSAPPPSPATNTLAAKPAVARPLRRVAGDARPTRPDVNRTVSTGGQDAATSPTQAVSSDPKTAAQAAHAAPATQADPPEHHVPSNTAGRGDDTAAVSRTGEANAAPSAAAALAAPDTAPIPPARGGASGIRQVSSLVALAEPAAPPGRASSMTVLGKTDQPSDRAGIPTPASRTGPSAAGRADQMVPDAPAGHARADATALTSPAPALDATLPAASAAAVASEVGFAAARASAATGPAAAVPSARATPTDARTPAQQAVSALVSLGGGQGSRQVTVRLDPPELGRLQIRLVQPKDGPAQVAVTAERPQTLDLLVRDETRLSRALDQAGVPAEGRSVTFHLAAAASGTAADPSRNAPLPAAPGPQSAGTGASDAGNGSDRGAQRDAHAAGQRRLSGGAAQLEDDTPRAVRWLRAGINITA